MAEVRLDHLDRAAGGDEGAGVGVSQVVETDAWWQADPTDGAGPRLAEPVLWDGPAIPVGDEQFCRRRLFALEVPSEVGEHLLDAYSTGQALDIAEDVHECRGPAG